MHNAEYYSWFLRPDAPVPHGVRVREYLFRLDDLERNFVDEQSASAEAEAGVSPAAQSEEYAPRVIAALEANRLYRFMGNAVNDGGMIANLPLDCCVEVPCYIDGNAVVPGVIGPLPEQCAALNRTAINVQLLTVTGILEGRKDTIYQAALLDPLLSAQLSIDETVALVDELIEAHGNPSGLK